MSITPFSGAPILNAAVDRMCAWLGLAYAQYMFSYVCYYYRWGITWVWDRHSEHEKRGGAQVSHQARVHVLLCLLLLQVRYYLGMRSPFGVWEKGRCPGFSSSQSTGSLMFVIVTGEVLPGCEIAIRSMRKWEVSKFLIKQEYMFSYVCYYYRWGITWVWDRHSQHEKRGGVQVSHQAGVHVLLCLLLLQVRYYLGLRSPFVAWGNGRCPGFSSSRSTCSLMFVIITGEVLPGFEITIRSMRKGEVSRFLIKPEYMFSYIICLLLLQVKYYQGMRSPFGVWEKGRCPGFSSSRSTCSVKWDAHLECPEMPHVSWILVTSEIQYCEALYKHTYTSEFHAWLIHSCFEVSFPGAVWSYNVLKINVETVE